MKNIRIKFLITAIVAGLSFQLTACSGQEFSPYRHMSTIMTITRQEQYDQDKRYILDHTSADLQDILDAALTGSIYDSNYSMKERSVFTQKGENTTKIIIEYECTSSSGNYLEVAFFEYANNILVNYDIKRITPRMDFC